MTTSDDPVAYVFQADMHCPGCTLGLVRGARHAPAAASTVEAALDHFARLARIDRYDEYSYDSGTFPKVVFIYSLQPGDRCGTCGEEL